MGRITYQGRNGKLRIYDGSSPPSYVEVPFSKMNFSGPLSKPRPIDPVVVTIGGYTHVPEGPDYEKALYDPLPIGWSCSLDDTTNTWKLRDALCNPDLNTPWTVGGASWISTKGQGSIILPDGNYVGTEPFFDVMKQAVNVEILFTESRAAGGSAWGMRYSEAYFPPQDSSYQENADDIEMAIKGLVYGNVQQIGGYTPGNES